MPVAVPSLGHLGAQSHHDHVAAESHHDYMHEKTMLLVKAAAREYHSYFLDASGCF